MVLQLLCYAAGMPGGSALVVATALGCAAYVVLWMRQAPDEGD
jgi:hypothetical protein